MMRADSERNDALKLLLIAETGTLAGRQFELEQGSLELGRGDSCGVRFGAEETEVSRRHAVIALGQQGFQLDDTSTNGTLVNGRPVRSAILQSGDVLQLGANGPRLRVALASTVIVALPRTEEPGSGTRPSLAEASLYDPARDKGRRHNLLGTAAVFGMILAGAFLGLLTALLTSFELGPGAALAGVIVAFLPAPVYLAI